MKKALIILGIISLTGSAFAQQEEPVNTADQKQMQRVERKKQRKEEAEKAFKVTKSILEQKQFVLEADLLGNKTGTRIPVNSTLNFVMIDTTHCVIQLGSNSGLGANGVGGVTTEGKISKYLLDTNKRGDGFILRVYTNTTLGAFDINYYIDSFGNAQADVTQTVTGVVRRYYGDIVSLENSRIYKGQSL